MKKVFKFTARQGQHEMVCRVLRQLGKPHVQKVDGGVQVTLLLPTGVSKTTVDRMLHAAGVPGASRRSNTPVISGDKWDVMYSDVASSGKAFKWVQDGRFKPGKYKRVWDSCGDPVCGCGMLDLERQG